MTKLDEVTLLLCNVLRHKNEVCTMRCSKKHHKQEVVSSTSRPPTPPSPRARSPRDPPDESAAGGFTRCRAILRRCQLILLLRRRRSGTTGAWHHRRRRLCRRLRSFADRHPCGCRRTTITAATPRHRTPPRCRHFRLLLLLNLASNPSRSRDDDDRRWFNDAEDNVIRTTDSCNARDVIGGGGALVPSPLAIVTADARAYNTRCCSPRPPPPRSRRGSATAHEASLDDRRR